jgi:NAD-dependent dihydropyrimidine dehydrogenase PreA subunit
VAHFDILLDASGCKACGYCKIVCPQNVYEQGAALNKKGYAPFYPARPEACVGCLRCFYVCPDFCLEVIPSATADRSLKVLNATPAAGGRL